jgi:flagellar biosynthesis protein FlhG
VLKSVERPKKAEIDQAAGLRRMFGARHQLVAFASGDNRCGRTALLVQTAKKLAEAGERVVLIDENTGPESALASLKVETPGDLWDSLIGSIALERLIIPVRPNLWAIAANGVATRLHHDTPVIRSKIEMLMNPLLAGASFVLINSRLAVGSPLSVLSSTAQHMVVVVGAETTAITESYGLIKQLALERGREGFHVVITGPQADVLGGKIVANLKKTAMDHLGVRIDLLATIRKPVADNVAEELFSRLPLLAQGLGDQLG